MKSPQKKIIKVGTRTIAKEIAKATGQKLDLVNHILKILPFHILRHVLDGKAVRLTSLGRFIPVKRKARLGLNLKMKREMWPATIRMQFKPSQEVKTRLKQQAIKEDPSGDTGGNPS